MINKLIYIIPTLFSFFLIFNYKQANVIIDKIFCIKRKNKKNKKINYRYFIYLVPILLLMFLDYFARKNPSSLKTSEKNSLLEQSGLYNIIPESIITYILNILGAYGVVMLFANDIGIKSGIIQKTFMKLPVVQFLLLWAGAYALTGTESQGLISTLLYLAFKYNVGNNNTASNRSKAV